MHLVVIKLLPKVFRIQRIVHIMSSGGQLTNMLHNREQSVVLPSHSRLVLVTLQPLFSYFQLIWELDELLHLNQTVSPNEALQLDA